MWFQSWKTVNRKGLRKLLDVENRHTTGKNFVGAEEIARDKKVVDEHTAHLIWELHVSPRCRRRQSSLKAPQQLEVTSSVLLILSGKRIFSQLFYVQHIEHAPCRTKLKFYRRSSLSIFSSFAPLRGMSKLSGRRQVS